MRHATRRLLPGLLLTAALTAAPGCGEDAAPDVEPTHRVRVFVVGKRSTGQSRRISGRVEAADESTLSFGVGGQVAKVIAQRGQTVVEGQELARLDDEPHRLAAEEARANLASARARLVEAEATYDRVKDLVARRAAAQKELDAATTGLATADGDVKAAQGALDRAQLDLARTRLVAPFPGQVVDVTIDPFQDVAAGEPAVVLSAAGALKVELLVPETMIRDVDYGQTVRVTFPTLEGEEVPATVTRIGAAAESGNAFPVTVRLAESEADLRPGMTAGVTFDFSAYLDGRTAYLVPLSALAIDAALLREPPADADAGSREAPLFVFDPETGTVRYRAVRVGDLRGNEVEVFEGLESGDQVVSAGVAFLRDGMRAAVWEPRR